MTSLFSYVAIIVLGGLLLGMLVYSFYLVLTSKDEHYKKPDPGDSGKKLSKKGSKSKLAGQN